MSRKRVWPITAEVSELMEALSKETEMHTMEAEMSRYRKAEEDRAMSISRPGVADRMHLQWSKQDREKAIEMVVRDSKSLQDAADALGRSPRGVYAQIWKQGWRGVNTLGDQVPDRLYRVSGRWWRVDAQTVWLPSEGNEDSTADVEKATRAAAAARAEARATHAPISTGTDTESLITRVAILEGMVAKMVDLATADSGTQPEEETPKQGLISRLMGRW